MKVLSLPLLFKAQLYHVLAMPGRPPQPDYFGIADNCQHATVDYFIEIFGYQESLELSNIDAPTENTIKSRKIQVALNDAATLINNYILTAPPQGKILIAGSYRRTQALIARWYLDTLRPRQHVIDMAQAALEQLELWASKATPGSGIKWQEAYRFFGSGCGTMVQHEYARGRSFTEPSTGNWVLMQGSNQRRQPLPRLEAVVVRRGECTAREDCGAVDAVMPESILLANKLVDALERTRGMASFKNTAELVTPDAGDIAVVKDGDGNFVLDNGLRESDTF